jgi:hypothetical protein
VIGAAATIEVAPKRLTAVELELESSQTRDDVLIDEAAGDRRSA